MAFYLAFYDDAGNSTGTGGGETIALGLTSRSNAFDSSRIAKRFQLTIPPGASVTLKAVKFEIGEGQTLAHQDTSGNWILNEIPDYGEQLAKCQRQLLILNAKGLTYNIVGGGDCNNVEYVYIQVPLPVSMRTTPSIIATGEWRIRNSSTKVVTNILVFKMSENIVTLRVSAELLTVGAYYSLLNLSDTTARLELSAEITP